MKKQIILGVCILQFMCITACSTSMTHVTKDAQKYFDSTVDGIISENEISSDLSLINQLEGTEVTKTDLELYQNMLEEAENYCDIITKVYTSTSNELSGLEYAKQLDDTKYTLYAYRTNEKKKASVYVYTERKEDSKLIQSKTLIDNKSKYYEFITDNETDGFFTTSEDDSKEKNIYKIDDNTVYITYDYNYNNDSRKCIVKMYFENEKLVELDDYILVSGQFNNGYKTKYHYGHEESLYEVIKMFTDTFDNVENKDDSLKELEEQVNKAFGI